jgi:hypothetical protein
VHVSYDAAGEWHEEARLRPANIAPTEHFGASIDFVDHSLFVGTPRDDVLEPTSGAGYVDHLSPGDWHRATKLTPFDAAGRGEFGTAIASDGSRVTVSAPWADSSVGAREGAPYVYEDCEPEFIGDMFCFGDGSQGARPCGNAAPVGWSMGCANSTGRGARIYGRGTPGVAPNAPSIDGQGFPSSWASYLLAALAALASGPANPIGDSLSCLTTPRVRSWPLCGATPAGAWRGTGSAI